MVGSIPYVEREMNFGSKLCFSWPLELILDVEINTSVNKQPQSDGIILLET